MARSQNEAILIVLDVGPGAGCEISLNGKTFLSNAQLCATKIIQRKILSSSKDEIGLILLGSEETNNPLADGEAYENIEISHSFELAKWSMVKTIANFKTCTSVDGDWLDALIVAADYMKTATEVKIFKEKKIVMLTNFRSDVSDDAVELVIQGLKNENVQLIVIGPQVYTSDTQETRFAGQNKSEDQIEGEKLIARIVDAVENTSVICGFEDALSQLQYFGQKKVRPTPWNVTMDIGSNIKIPVSAYKKISEVKRIQTHDIIIPKRLMLPTSQSPVSQEVNDPHAHPTKSETQDDFQGHPIKPPTQDSIPEEMDFTPDFNLVDKDRIYKTLGDDATPVDVTDIIQGYMYGTTIVPVTEDDKPGLAYASGPKSLSVLGFSNKRYVPLSLLKGECLYIFPQKTEEVMKAFAALVQAMDSKDMVAIARRVYARDNVPVLWTLFPKITPEFQCFVGIELPYSEQVNRLIFPPLITDSIKPSREQLQVVDQLITSMDLMRVDNDEESETGQYYDPETTLDPYEQHYYNLVAQKALNGECYISGSDVDEAVKLLLCPKEELLEASKAAVHKIKELFPLTEVTPKEGARKAAADIFQEDIKPADIADQTTSKQSSDTKDVIPRIGTVHPHEDFKNLLSQGISLDKACSLLEQVIREMVLKAFDADDFTKPYKCLILMRKECLEKNPSTYNDWIIKFKQDLPVEKVGFWDMVVKDQAGLITSSESNQSTITAEEGRTFLRIDDVNDDLPPTQSADEDLDDLIGQM